MAALLPSQVIGPYRIEWSPILSIELCLVAAVPPDYVSRNEGTAAVFGIAHLAKIRGIHSSAILSHIFIRIECQSLIIRNNVNVHISIAQDFSYHGILSVYHVRARCYINN